MPLTTCTTSLDGGVAHLEQLGAVFAHARGAVEAANQGIDDIARAVSEHSGNSGNIASHIDQIAAMAERNSQAVAEAHKATRSLVDLTGQLQTSISRFRV